MRISTPAILRPVATLVKKIIRNAIYWRLDTFSLTTTQAEKWAEKFKNWPAIFDVSYSRRVEVFPGVFMDAGLIDVIQRTLIVDGAWDVTVATLLQKCLKPGDTFFDIGANIGYFTLYASRLVGDGGKVVAFEPSRRALQVLTRHLNVNNCSNVVLFSFGAGSENELKTLQLATLNNIGASSFRPLESPVGFEYVPVLRLDDVIPNFEIVPNVIKIDTEGFEFDVLKGMEQLLQSMPTVVCELTNDFLNVLGYCAEDVIEYMKGLGYRSFVLEGDNSLRVREVHSGDSFSDRFQQEILFMNGLHAESMLREICAPV